MGNTLSAYKETQHVVDLGSKGKIKGVQFDDKARRYAGVPYSLPPTGQYRWRKPRQLPEGFCYQNQNSAPFDATGFAPPCPQSSFSSAEKDTTQDDEEFSEDCLVLNIWTPVIDKGKKWPVYVWLHGGWFQMGTPSQEEGMSPVELISTGQLDAIFVAVGYRLNVFGFLACEELESESGGEYAGNFGLWDQRLALEWVKANIAKFNGDTDNITLAGRSAGAYGVHAQLLHEYRKSVRQSMLFHRVFMCSNAIPAQPRPLAEAQPQFDELCAHFRVPMTSSAGEKLVALRKLSSRQLIEAIKHLTRHTFRPVTEGLFITPGLMEYQDSPAFAASLLKDGISLLIGEVLNEETLYATYNPPNAGIESLKVELANYYGDSTAEKLLKHYQLPAEGSDEQCWRAMFGQIVSDGQVRASSRALIRNLSSNGMPSDKIWRYQIACRLSFITKDVAPMSFGVAHAMDKPFWNYSIIHGPTEKERALMDEWIQILVAFVHNDASYRFGTKGLEEMKVATPDAMIQVQQDARWSELVDLGKAFAR